MSRPVSTSSRSAPGRALRPERPSEGSGRLVIAGAVSLIAHSAVAVLLLAGGAPGASTTPPAVLEEPPPPPEHEDEVTLGSDSSQSTSITWIGFDEYKEHVLQQKSEVDQPELSLDSPAGTPAPPVLTQSPPTQEQTPREAQQQPVPQEVAAAMPQEPATEEPVATPPPAPVISQAPPETPEDLPGEVAQADEPVIAEQVGPPPEEPAPESTTPAEEKPASEPEETPPTPKAPSPVEPQEAVPEAAPPQKPGAAPGNDATGQKSDRESDASATVTATVSKLGQPLVAHGLQIQTIRPRFTYYTQVTASPKAPVVRVQFDRAGRVYKAQIVRSSGSADVDRPLLDAIYQWRAKGKQLEGLSAGNPPETVSIEFRILL